jgi:hypothetical protein
MYQDLTRLFPFVLLEGSVCFFILYHYESNGIIADPITGVVIKQYLRHTRSFLIS